MRAVAWMVATVLCIGEAGVAEPTLSPARQMAATVIRQWPAGVISTIKRPGSWGYEEGVLLDGMTAEGKQTGDPADFAYVKAAVDKYISPEGAIRGLATGEHTLDDIEMGRAVLVVYRQTREQKYAQAARSLHDQLLTQPRTPSGAYWHKQIYPNQVWLDGAYMAAPFRAAYAVTFNAPAEFDDIARQILLMDAHMRDPATGLLRHGWDESRTMEWADKKSGLSPAVWGRAMGWYCMALVDTLDWFPADHPQRPALIAALNRAMVAVLAVQDAKSGLWWQVMDRGSAPGNFPEASASAMFVYSLAKGVRKGYLPSADKAAATRGWQGIQKQFVTSAPDGSLTLTGTVKVGGLGGKPYRSGTFDYYIGEKTGDNDAKGVGAYLLAGSEMEQTAH